MIVESTLSPPVPACCNAHLDTHDVHELEAKLWPPATIVLLGARGRRSQVVRPQKIAQQYPTIRGACGSIPTINTTRYIVAELLFTKRGSLRTTEQSILPVDSVPPSSERRTSTWHAASVGGRRLLIRRHTGINRSE